MAILTGRAKKDTYKDLLKVENGQDGLSTTPVSVEAGNGDISALKIGTESVKINDIRYPIVDGTSGQALVTDGAGTATFATVTTSTEEVQDIVGAMVSGNTETLISVTYQDSDGTLDFEITDAELTAIAGLTSAADKGIMFTGAGTAATYTITAAGLAILDDVDASAQRTTLGLAIGTNVQAQDATLQSIAALGTAADRTVYTTGIDTWAETPLTSFGRSLIDDANASAARTTLGVIIGTDVQAQDATLTSIALLGTAADKIAYTTGIDTWAETTITAFGRSLIDDADAATGRTTLAAAGSATTITVAGTANEITSSAGAQDLSANRTWTLSLPSSIDLGGKDSLEIPNSAAPTVNADGEIAVDTSVADFSHGILKYYGGEEMGVIAMPIASFGSPTNGYTVTYDSTADEFILAAASAVVADGDKGDISISGGVWSVDNDVVTYAKMQNVSATDKLLGRSTAGAGDVEEIACTAAGRAILDDADNTAQRTTLGLGTIATQAANNVSISGGAITGITDITVTDGGTGVSTMTTAYAPVCAGTTATGALQVASTGLSTSGYVLTSNGASAVPSFQAAAGGDAVPTLVDTQTFTSTGNWSNAVSGDFVTIECWGGGGAGGAAVTNGGAGGGGGGAYVRRIMLFSDVANNTTATIGDGGTGVAAGNTGNVGGTTTFGAYLSAYGGGGGSFVDTTNAGAGGGGGGSMAAGGSASGGTVGAAGQPNYYNLHGGGNGGDSSTTPANNIGKFAIFGGAGGGGGRDSASADAGAGGNAIYGGGGGGGSNGGTSGIGAGGTSTYGGAGGAGTKDSAAGNAGSVPGGGGGATENNTSGAGGKGKCVVKTYTGPYNPGIFGYI